MINEIILKTVLTIVGFCITGLLGFFTAQIKQYKKKEKDDEKERELLKNGVKMLLQSNLTNVFYVHNELGQIEDYKLKNWFNELKEYYALGGNDYMHVLEEKMSKLKIIHTGVLGD